MIIDQVDMSEPKRAIKVVGHPVTIHACYSKLLFMRIYVTFILREIIEQVLHENIHFMWLSGQSRPDHNTINDFRGKRLQGHLKKIPSGRIAFGRTWRCGPKKYLCRWHHD